MYCLSIGAVRRCCSSGGCCASGELGTAAGGWVMRSSCSMTAAYRRSSSVWFFALSSSITLSSNVPMLVWVTVDWCLLPHFLGLPHVLFRVRPADMGHSCFLSKGVVGVTPAARFGLTISMSSVLDDSCAARRRRRPTVKVRVSTKRVSPAYAPMMDPICLGR